MSDLKSRIIEAIRIGGPMPVSLYMTMCLHDPRGGYYATRPGFNRDFTTAPETSQVFGELLGVWAAHEWDHLGSPSPFHLIELGPGRGTMMADMLRAASRMKGFAEAARIALVEASPALRAVQAETLAGHTITHYDTLEAVPPGSAIIIANEFLDCLPIRQFVRDKDGWRERQIGLDAAGELIFGIGPQADLPDHVAPQGDHLEAAPGLETLVDAIAQRFSRHPGRALFIDYGPVGVSPADTLRAYESGRQLDPLSHPGASDLTADVDFRRLALLADAHDLAFHGPMEQGAFLTRLGALDRAHALAAANPARAAEIHAAVEKLTAPDQMGARFKALALTRLDSIPAVGF